jgi:thioredoxin reductase
MRKARTNAKEKLPRAAGGSGLLERDPVGSLFDTIIVGGGPAGLSAALVLGRCMRRVLLFDDKRYRNAQSHALHCYMGLDGIAPAELHDRARDQLSRYETVAIKSDRVHSVERQEPFIVHTAQGHVRARTILVASGVVDELPPVSGLPELFGTSVHVCPYCDAWEHRNAAVAVYGRSEKGVELALMLRLWTNDLILCTDGDVLTSKQQERLQARGVDWREERIHSVEDETGCLQAIRFLSGDAVARKACFLRPASTRGLPCSRALAVTMTTRAACKVILTGGRTSQASMSPVMFQGTCNWPS